jgi:PAS domain S-box-containing protein
MTKAMSHNLNPITAPARLRTLFAKASVGLSVTDLSGRFVAANEAYSKITGYSEQELTRTDYRSITYPLDLPENLRLATRVYTGEISQAVYEKRYVRKSGDLRWVRNSVSALCNASGRITNVVALTEDISDWRNSARSVRQSNDRIRGVVDSPAERHRIASGLEGDTSQLMVAVSLRLQELQESFALSPAEKYAISEAVDLVSRFVGYMSSLADILSPPVTPSAGLRQRLVDCVERFKSSASAPVEMKLAGGLEDLPPDTESSVLSAAQLGLAEFRSGAGVVFFRVSRDRSRITVEAQRAEEARGESDPESIDIARLRHELRRVGGSVEVGFAEGHRRFRASIKLDR